MENTIQELRTELFDTLKLLKNNDIEIERANAIVQVAQAIINSAKVEVEFVRAINASSGSGFIPVQKQIPDA